MKVRATLMAVATAIALSGAPHPVPITIYGASQEYTAKVAKWYDEAPQALRSKINPLLMTFDNTHTLATLYTSWGFMSAQNAAQYRGSAVLGVARYEPGTKKTYLALVERKDLGLEDERARRVVIHEMAHLYDHTAGELSSKIEFKKAYDQDKKEAVVFWKQSDQKTRDDIDLYSHYLGKPTEAFAEAVARVIYPPTNEIDRNNFAQHLFPRVTAIIKARLKQDGIIQ
jgi:hypothetical protein